MSNDDELTFDFGAKKKKKATTTAPATETKTEESAAAPEESNTEGAELEFDFGSKKKKKKEPAAAPAEPAGDDDGDLEFDFGKKKKKKPSEQAKESAEPTQTNLENIGATDDYTYEDLCSRIYTQLQEKNPNLSAGARTVSMKPPQIAREGTKKSVWINFAEICKTMARKVEHVQSYVFAELGTTGSIDGANRLVIKGRFQPKQIETVLRHYIHEYVACRTCHSADTVLKKENRLYFMLCQVCGSKRSVAPIKKGFEAQVGRRKK